MKKIIIILILIFSFGTNTKAFLGDDLGSDLYKNINAGINDLEIKQYEYELKGQGTSIKENINKILKTNGLEECIAKEITSEEIEKISNGDIGILHDKIGNNCKNDNKNITSDLLNKIQKIIQKTNIITKNKAKEKTITLNNISKIGLYSDGNEDNSPFDLITDLQNIDYYIFTEEIEYRGEELSNNDEIMDGVLGIENFNNKLIANNSETGLSNLFPGSEFDNSELIPTVQVETNPDNITNNSFKCLDSNQNQELSGLNPNTISNIINNLNDSSQIDSGDNISGNDSEDLDNGINEMTLNELTLEEDSDGVYKKLNDNSTFPCDGFFCISIEFITYQHNLLGGSGNISIEYLINRSNKHLKKFAATSLIQAEMTSNNWEFGLKDLNLPDIFHVGFVVTKKPIPILDLKKDESKKDKTDLSKDNLLQTYYKNYGLDYSRKNDLKLFEGNYDEIKTIIDLASLGIGKLNVKTQELEEINNKKIQKNDFVSKDVFKKVGNNESSNFEKRLIELRKFSKSIKEYVDFVDDIVRFMNKIPIDKG